MGFPNRKKSLGWRQYERKGRVGKGEWLGKKLRRNLEKTFFGVRVFLTFTISFTFGVKTGEKGEKRRQYLTNVRVE